MPPSAKDKRICLMIIQFNPALSSRDAPADPHSEVCDSMNWLHGQPDQVAFSKCEPPEANSSKIVNLALACMEEPAHCPNYVEEIKAKPFKGENSIALFADEELLATARRREANHSAARWANRKFLDGLEVPDALESLPDAA